MATFEAIYGLSSAIKNLLEENCPAEWGAPIVSVVQPTEISMPSSATNGSYSFTICLYRISVSGTQRPQTPRRDEQGRLFRPSRLVDLHYLITPWSTSIESQHKMLGWLINLIEDRGTLSSAHLNNKHIKPDIFGVLESVQLSFEPMPLTEHFNLWDKLRNGFPASATCVARMVALDSMRPIDEPELVKIRKLATYQAEVS